MEKRLRDVCITVEEYSKLICCYGMKAVLKGNAVKMVYVRAKSFDRGTTIAIHKIPTHPAFYRILWISSPLYC